MSKPPQRDGVGASTVQLPPGDWPNLLDFLDARFADVGRAIWQQRFARALVLDSDGEPLGVDAAYRSGQRVHYYRELPPEVPIPFSAEVLHRDGELVVVDKPHFLPVLPSGRYVQETLLVRLRRELGIDALTPLHRIDRDTAGLVLFSCNPATRGTYTQLFAQRAVEKTYEALAPALPQHTFPLAVRSRLVRGEPFFRTQTVDGEANSETRIEIAERRGALNLYRLYPHSGRKHQLRVHLASLGAPIVNDPLYPDVIDVADGDYSRPLQLLAKELRFADPLTGAPRHFVSRRRLDAATAAT